MLDKISFHKHLKLSIQENNNLKGGSEEQYALILVQASRTCLLVVQGEELKLYEDFLKWLILAKKFKPVFMTNLKNILQ